MLIGLALIALVALWYLLWLARGFVAASPTESGIQVSLPDVREETTVDLTGRGHAVSHSGTVTHRLTVAHIDGDEYALNTENSTIHVFSPPEVSKTSNAEILAGAVAVYAAQETRRALRECPSPVVECHYTSAAQAAEQIADITLRIRVPRSVDPARIEELNQSISAYLSALRAIPITVNIQAEGAPPEPQIHLPVVTP